jgi:2-polyprenyl-6-methoxyphenol hydroxylase-like FAD-dependent oxidoreductase
MKSTQPFYPITTPHPTRNCYHMAKQTISIIGAGLSGLTLSRCLRQHGIQSILYDRSSSPAPHSYGITLYASSYTPLLKALNTSEPAFKSRVAVDAAIDGAGKIADAYVDAGTNTGPCLRVNRGKLEEWLREGVDVRWEHKLRDVEADDEAPILRFENGQTVQNTLIIDASGPHSSLKKSLLPDSDLKILPFVVFNGKRRISRKQFDKEMAAHMHDSTIVNFTHGDARLNFSINEYSEEKVSVSWTYSRPSRGDGDGLHKPDRGLSDATSVPEELFDELHTLCQSLPQPFDSLFEPELLRKDRILHWLMRTSHLDIQEAQGLARKGIVLIGDAAHAEPIVGGNGANEALDDGTDLAAWIAKRGSGSLEEWIEQRHGAWGRGVQDGEEKIKKLHGKREGRL